MHFCGASVALFVDDDVCIANACFFKRQLQLFAEGAFAKIKLQKNLCKKKAHMHSPQNDRSSRESTAIGRIQRVFARCRPSKSDAKPSIRRPVEFGCDKRQDLRHPARHFVWRRKVALALCVLWLLASFAATAKWRGAVVRLRSFR